MKKIFLSFFFISAIFLFPIASLAQGEAGTEEDNSEAPQEVEIDVPFTSQAPEGNWAEPWQNACEETSIIMIDSFYEEDGELTREEAKQEILEVLRTKEAEFNFTQDESMATIVEVIDLADLGWKATIVNNPTVEQMQSELDKKQPIIVPVYAPKLNNPYYTDGGPDYHVMVIVGYDDETQEFLVHDPGTQSGEDLRFSYEVILDAIHDYNSEEYTAGEKTVLFTEPRLRQKIEKAVKAVTEATMSSEKSNTAVLLLVLMLVFIWGVWFVQHRKTK